MTTVSVNIDTLKSTETLVWTAYDSNGLEVDSGTVQGIDSKGTSFNYDVTAVDTFETIVFAAGTDSKYQLTIDHIYRSNINY